MKRKAIGTMAVVAAMSALTSAAAPPMPSFRYYGRLSDEYGWPVTLDKDVSLVLRVGTNECARFTANEQLGSGINYILEVPVDYAKGTRYAAYAARTGDVVTISAYRSGLLQPLMNTSSVPVVGTAGDAVHLDLNMGTDEDQDGMSDLWETQLIIANSDGLYTHISQVLPGDDFDGDGTSNLDEFRAGTAPEVAGDAFQVYRWMEASDGTLAARFLTVKGTTYRIEWAPPRLEGQHFRWGAAPFRTSVGGSDVLDHTAAASGWTYFYVLPQTNATMIRLEVIR
jgi:hypothetical protein